MKYKFIATDFDDTLIRDDHTVSQETIDTIHKFIDMGGVFVFATGRALNSIHAFAKSINVETFIISYNGASLYDMKKGEELLQISIPYENAVEVIKEYERQGVYCQIYNKGRIFTKSQTENSDEYQRLSGCKIECVEENLSAYVEREKLSAMKILAITDPTTAAKLTGVMQEKLGEDHQFFCSKPRYLECVSKDAGKGEMCAKLIAKLGIKQEETMTFGDGQNDISLLKFGGMGVAVENGGKEVKEACDYVTDTNNNDGVRKAIEKFIF